MKQIKRVMKYFWGITRRRSWMFWCTLVCYGAGAVIARTFIPIIYRDLIDLIVSADSPLSVKGEIYSLLGTLILSFIALNIFFRAADYIFSAFQSRSMRDLYSQAFSMLQNHSYNFFSNVFSGSFIAKTKRYVSAFEDIFDRFFYDFWFTFVIVVGAIIVLFTEAPTVGWVVLAGISVFVTAVIILSNKGRPLREIEARRDSETTGSFSDAISNIFAIKSFANGEKEQKTFDHVLENQHKARIRAWNFDNKRIAILGIIFFIMEVGGMYVAITLWMKGSITPGTVALVQIYFGNIFYNIWNFGRAIQRFNKSIADSVEIIDIFEKPIDIKDISNPEESKIKNGNIDFNKALFRYPNGVAVFDDLNLNIRAGQKVGLVGHSGAGKTTITKLLLRFYDVSDGEVLIDGQNIDNIRQDDLRRSISYVPQDPLLFHRSIKENISYGKNDATMEEIIDSAKRARAHDFITQLPMGYDTLVGERGVKLSGGERQRVAIARAMLKPSPILILDEATSSLDSISESAIQEALDELMKGKTTIAIAHRLSTIQKMDRIIVMDNGKIAEDGTHNELIAKKGIYFELWSHQTKGFIE